MISPYEICDLIWGRGALRWAAKNGVRLSKCMEVGVNRADYSRVIMRVAKPDLLVLVDPYIGYDFTSGKLALANALIATAARIEAQRRMAKYGDRVEWHIATFSDFFHYSLSAKLCDYDFVYIDAEHTYKATLEDMLLGWELVRHGGILAGHDTWNPQVFRAVATFQAKYNVDVSCHGVDWWVVK